MTHSELQVEEPESRAPAAGPERAADRRGVRAPARVPRTPGWMRVLPYAALVGAVWAIPHTLYRPSAEGNEYHLSVLIYVGINTILAVGLNLLMGYAGQVSLGHAAFYGLGAYVSAILTAHGVPDGSAGPVAAGIATMVAAAGVIALLRAESGRLALGVGGFALAVLLALKLGAAHPAPYLVGAIICLALARLLRWSPARLGGAYALGGAAGCATLALLGYTGASGGISPWAAIPVGVLFSCLVAYLIGVQALRLHGNYLAMATLGFGVIVSIVFREWEPVTGGTSGIYGIPNLAIAGRALDSDLAVYWLVWAVVIVVIALSANIVDSRVGRAFRAVHGSETAATTLGVDTSRYKVQVFVLSAALASIAGSLYAHYVTFVSPEPFGMKFSVELVVIVVVGGMASIWGAIFGAGAITVLGQLLQHYGDRSVGGVALSDVDVAVFGLILMLIMIYLPAGLVRGVVDSARLAARAWGKGGRDGR